ncbi:hypothetical protein LCGC14_0595020 [marine sediment metagenome]|uniref:Uncharacterized protein n=1 Tax=marine sediment metagenome TaxID=412755 RepID=A0A0F9UKM1_9ZZZZ
MQDINPKEFERFMNAIEGIAHGMSAPSKTEELFDGRGAQTTVTPTLADAIFHLSESVSLGFSSLGTADAATPMGAIESLGVAIIEAANTIGSALTEMRE